MQWDLISFQHDSTVERKHVIGCIPHELHVVVIPVTTLEANLVDELLQRPSWEVTRIARGGGQLDHWIYGVSLWFRNNLETYESLRNNRLHPDCHLTPFLLKWKENTYIRDHNETFARDIQNGGLRVMHTHALSPPMWDLQERSPARNPQSHWQKEQENLWILLAYACSLIGFPLDSVASFL